MSPSEAKAIDARSQRLRALAKHVRGLADDLNYRGDKELSVMAHDLARQVETEATTLQKRALTRFDNQVVLPFEPA
jgi:hypothetical protein